MEYDGFIILRQFNVGLTQHYVNDTLISSSAVIDNTGVTTTLPVLKGDRIYSTNIAALDIHGRFYKNRDYSNR